MKKTLAVGAFILVFGGIIHASNVENNFSRLFCDSTLRVDLSLSGAPGDVSISFIETSMAKGWHGRRVNLDSILYAGNAQVVVIDASTSDTIYRQGFSSLFQEWLIACDPTPPIAMESVVLVPYPRKQTYLEIILRDNHRREIAKSKRLFNPEDVLTRHISDTPKSHVTPLHIGSYPDSSKIRVAILAEGYTSDEMSGFLGHAATAVESILSYEPFSEYADRFDFIAVESPSKDSGVSIPKEGLWLQTPYRSHFSTFHSDRYLTTPGVREAYESAMEAGCQHIIILANTEEYGGGGIFNDYTTTAARHPYFAPVVVHEFGHSFGGLGDEYFYEDEDSMGNAYPSDVEPWEPNITTKADFSKKWQKLIDNGQAGLIEGGGYVAKGVWRGAENCRMRTNTAETFCPVCIEALRKIILFYTE